jgi:hypothetical protein
LSDLTDGWLVLAIVAQEHMKDFGSRILCVLGSKTDLNNLSLKKSRDPDKYVRDGCVCVRIRARRLDVEYLLSDYCKGAIQGVDFWPERRFAMDTMTYASVAVLPKSIAEEHTQFVRHDLDLLPLDLSMIKR